MKLKQLSWRDALHTMVILVVVFLINIFLQEIFDTRTLVPMNFVLGVFLISRSTKGYFWGITASLISVLAVNFTFTAPYYAFDLITPECLASAVGMLVVAIMTGALTTQIKQSQVMKAEGERERLRANLLRAVSHDLRTPLTSVYGACSAVIENYDSLTKAQQLKLLGEVQADAEWLIRMVENLLSVTRIGGEGVEISKQDTVLEELIDAVLLKFHKSYPDQNVALDLPEEFVSIPMDAMLIQQVLLNLLENAVYHAKGMTELHLGVQIWENQAVFSVWDNGCGIPAGKLERLFSGDLDQTQPAADSRRRNMGIGLSVCATIIKAHGGQIEASNLPQGGAIFRFSLKLEESYEQQ